MKELEIFYQFKQGDSVRFLARKYHGTVTEIEEIIRETVLILKGKRRPYGYVSRERGEFKE